MNNREISYTFGPDKVERVLTTHYLDLVCRAYQVISNTFSPSSFCSLISLLYVLRYKSCWLRLRRMDMNYLPRDNLSQYFRPLTTVVNLIMSVHWWVLMKNWCALSRFLSQLTKMVIKSWCQQERNCIMDFVLGFLW